MHRSANIKSRPWRYTVFGTHCILGISFALSNLPYQISITNHPSSLGLSALTSSSLDSSHLLHIIGVSRPIFPNQGIHVSTKVRHKLWRVNAYTSSGDAGSRCYQLARMGIFLIHRRAVYWHSVWRRFASGMGQRSVCSYRAGESIAPLPCARDNGSSRESRGAAVEDG